MIMITACYISYYGPGKAAPATAAQVRRLTLFRPRGPASPPAVAPRTALAA